MKATGRIHRVALLVFALLIFCATPGWSQGYERKVEVSWDFTTATTPLGWTPNFGPPSGFGLSNGALMFPDKEVVGKLYGPWISVPAAPLQVIEIEMSSDTTTGAGFSWPSEPCLECPPTSWRGTGFTILGDGEFHHYYLPIDTSSVTTIYWLNFGLILPGANLAIKSIALVTMVPSASPPVSPVWQFDTDGDFKGWFPYSGVLDILDMSVSGGRLRIKTPTDTTLLAPLAQVTTQMEWFSLSGSVTQSTLESPFVLFNLINTANNAASPKVFLDLVPDGVDHVYNQNFGWDRGDWPTASSLSITLSGNTTFAIERIQLSGAPEGRADVFVDALGSATSLVRAGTPFQLSCRVSDRGGEPVEQLSVRLTLPEDGSVRVVSSPSVPTTVQKGYPQTVTWTLVSSRAGDAPISVTAPAASDRRPFAAACLFAQPVLRFRVRFTW